MKKIFALAALVLAALLASSIASAQARLGLDVVDSADQKVGYALSSQAVVVFVDGAPYQIIMDTNQLYSGGMLFYEAPGCSGTPYMIVNQGFTVGSPQLWADAFFTQNDGMLHHPGFPRVTMTPLSQLTIAWNGSTSCYSSGGFGSFFLGPETVSALSFTPPFRVVEAWPVSPAPQIATFNDVPTYYPFFRYIEALYAAGITGGCGNGNYCPTEPLTRGQMAVFLAKALGL